MSNESAAQDNTLEEETGVLVAELDLSEESKTFFASELVHTWPYSSNFDLRKDVDSPEQAEIAYLIINSRDELEKYYTGDLKLPDIDFSNSTLVIGDVVVGSTASDLEELTLRESEDSYTLAAHCIAYPNGLATNLYHAFYKLYPKLADKMIYTKKLVKYNEKDKDAEDE